MRLILIRGLAREQRHWGPFVEMTEAAFPELKVHCLDFPGIGTEYGRTSPLKLEQISEDFLRRWRNLAFPEDEPLGLIGLSLGGMVALDWCARADLNLKFAVAINSSAANHSAPWKRLRLDFLSRVWRAQLSADPRWKEKVILSLVSNSPEARSRSLEEWTQLRISNPVPPGLMARQLAAASLFQAPEKERIKVPLLFLNSLKDQMVEPECSVALATYYRAPLRSHPWGGHDLTTDDPGWVIREVQQMTIENEILSASSLADPAETPGLSAAPSQASRSTGI